VTVGGPIGLVARITWVFVLGSDIDVVCGSGTLVLAFMAEARRVPIVGSGVLLPGKLPGIPLMPEGAGATP